MKINSKKNKNFVTVENKDRLAVSINKETTPKIHSKIAEDTFNNIVESALKEDKIINKEATTKEKEVKALGLREQEDMLYDGNLETVVSNRKEHGLAIPTAVEDYEKYALGDNGAFSDEMKSRAIRSLLDQLTAERNYTANTIEFLYNERAWSFKNSEENVIKKFYHSMSQKQYNEWRLKAEDFASEWIKNMAKKVEANPNYKPDSIDSVAEYKLYNIVKDKDNFSNLRSQIEKAFSYELAKKYSGNAFSETQQDFDNTNVQTVLQALGFVSPYGIYINKNDADKDRYQKEYDTNIDFVKKEIIIRDIVEQKDLLLSESLTKLIDKRKKLGLDNELTKRIEEIKEMKEKASDKVYLKAYNSAMRDLKFDFSEQLLLEHYGSDPKVIKLTKGERSFLDKLPSLPEYGVKIPVQEYGLLQDYIFSIIHRGYFYEGDKSFDKAFDEFQTFRVKNNLPKILGVEEIVNNTPGLFFKDNSETRKARKDIDKIMEDYVTMEYLGFVDKNKFEKFKEMQDYIAVPKAEAKYKEPEEYKNWRLKLLSSLEDAGSFFKEDSKPLWVISQADKKVIAFLENIVNGQKNSAKDEIEKLGKLFSKELKGYEDIDWKANPLAQKVLQATGLLGPNLKEINPKDRSQAEKAFDSYLENISKIVTEGNVYAIQNLFSLKSIINRNNSDLCNLVNLIVDGFNPILHQEKDKIAGSLGDLFDSSLRAEIKKERVKMGLPKIEAFEDLIFYDNLLLERVESQSKSFQELAENDEEYKATFNKAKDVFEKQTLAEKNGFADVNKYEYYKKREFFINAGEIINRLQQDYKTENIKAKTEVLNVNSNFIKEINSGEHNDFLKKIMDVIKENNPNAQELKKVETIIANISKKIETENVSQPTKTKKTITSPAASDNLGR
jgi:hypothetical protein